MSQILHKEFDFTQPGGFPLTQERLQYMQEATGEAITALIAAGGDADGPMIINGMQITEPSPGTFTVTDGWFIYNGRMVKFTGSTVSPAIGHVLLVTITQNTTDLLFYNTSTPPVQLSTTAALTTGASVTNAATFPLSAATEWASGIGLQQRNEGWSSFNFYDSYGTATSGLISSRRNRLTNTLHIKGEIYILDAQNTTAFGLGGTELSLTFGTLMHLPVSMISTEKIHIPNCVSVPSSPTMPIKTFSATNYFNSWKIELDNAGTFHTNIVRPEISVTQYRVYINHILSLD